MRSPAVSTGKCVTGRRVSAETWATPSRAPVTTHTNARENDMRGQNLRTMAGKPRLKAFKLDNGGRA